MVDYFTCTYIDNKVELKEPHKHLLTAFQAYREGIYKILKLESPNLHEIGPDRVSAYGHT